MMRKRKTNHFSSSSSCSSSSSSSSSPIHFLALSPLHASKDKFPLCCGTILFFTYTAMIGSSPPQHHIGKKRIHCYTRWTTAFQGFFLGLRATSRCFLDSFCTTMVKCCERWRLETHAHFYFAMTLQKGLISHSLFAGRLEASGTMPTHFAIYFLLFAKVDPFWPTRPSLFSAVEKCLGRLFFFFASTANIVDHYPPPVSFSRKTIFASSSSSFPPSSLSLFCQPETTVCVAKESGRQAEAFPPPPPPPKKGKEEGRGRMVGGYGKASHK